jgi:hypothetical protein
MYEERIATEVAGLMHAQSELCDLENLSQASRLCDWMYEQCAPLVRGEVGAGIGTFSARLLANPGVSRLLRVEPEPACAHQLTEIFGTDPRVTVAAETLPASTALRG